jgi:flagellar protein FlgJ
MNLNAIHPRIDPSQLPLESLAGNSSLSDGDKVAEVSRQFEAVLLRQILGDIRKPLLASAEGDPTINGIYSDMINNQLAESISRSGSFGLARSLTSQLSRQVLHQAPVSAETAAPALQSVRQSAKQQHDSKPHGVPASAGSKGETIR